MKYKNSPIYFVTSNRQKFTSLQKLLQPLGVDLKQLKYDFDEGRGWIYKRLPKVNYSKPRKLFQTSARSLMIVCRIPVLKGFPGPFVKLLLDSFSYPGIIKLMQGETDRRAIFSFAVGYFDGKKDSYFRGRWRGFIIDEPRGNNLHAQTELLYIYGHSRFPVAVWRNWMMRSGKNIWMRYLVKRWMGLWWWGIIWRE